MSWMAGLCGVFIVALGFWSTGSHPSETQAVTEIVCLVGGLILCFMAVTLARLGAVAARFDALEAALTEPEPEVGETGGASP